MQDPERTPLAALAPEDLIDRIARTRDKRAFEVLFDFYAPRIKSVLVRGGASPEQADEFAQEAMMTVWRKADYFMKSRGTASAWIFTIARNLRIDAARRQKRAQVYAMTEALDEPEQPPRPDDLVARGEYALRVRAAMRELPDEQLEVVMLSFVEGLPHSDISEKLELPLGTVKSRLRLAMRRMRKTLEDLA